MARASQSEPLPLPLPLPWSHPHSHNQDLFTTALQELRNLRLLLHSAAEYYEVAYLHSNQKNTIQPSLQDYCAKALVKSVDHLGTVASHLDESLSLLDVEISKLDLRTACVTARLSACHEKSDRKGLTRCQQMKPRKPIYLKHYNSGGKHFPSLPQLSPGKLQEIFQVNAGSDSSTLKSLSWYLAFESSSSAASKGLLGAKRSTSMEDKYDSFNKQEHFIRSLSSGQTPRCNQPFSPSVKKLMSPSSKTLGSLFMMDVEHKEGTAFCRIPFVSFLGRTKGLKSKSVDLSKQS
ncbi:hypothetical protein GOP47_0007785 [Adiantum capillus-veneris]|uniref:Uncharacterized protein n=1 Tax=Adiantum capillus-veneris TaxID=13818 RepID=A0A9D4V216_ADICA|nr:hypothetical protein GOP47_0007785 [Adiantum capillus-veneris]